MPLTESLQIPDHTVIALLGRGGMAEVHLARHTKLRRLVAVKVMDARFTADATFVRRFEREAQTAAGLSHPNIVPVFEYGAFDDGRRYLTMAYVENGSLRDRLKSGPLNHEEALAITRQVAGALALAHSKRIVHRDLKPDNILFQGEAASLTDFGIAKLMDATTQLTEAGSPGTVKYMSPEQAKGEPVDQRTDLYGLGVVLYEMLTGDLPIDAPSLPSMLYRLVNEPPGALPARLKGLQPLLDALLAKEQAQRIASAQDLITVIQQVERNLTRGMDLDHVMDNVTIVRSGAAANADLDAPARPDDTTVLPDAQARAPYGPVREPTGPTVPITPRAATEPTMPMAPHESAPAHADGDASQPTSSPRRAYTRWFVSGAAALVISALAGWVWIEFVNGPSDDERLKAFTEATRLQSEIEDLEQRLQRQRQASEQAVRDAESEVGRDEMALRDARGASAKRDAQRRLDDSERRQRHAVRIADLQERAVYQGTEYAELSGELSSGVALIDRNGNDNALAAERLTTVRAGYAALLVAAEHVATAVQREAEAESAEEAFAAWSQGKELTAESAESLRLKQARSSAKALIEAGAFADAAQAYVDVTQGWNAMRTNAERRLRGEAEPTAVQLAAEVERKDRERKAAEAAAGEAARKEQAQRDAEAARKLQAEQAVVATFEPAMVSIPAGSFDMGCMPGDGDCKADERPQHRVQVKAFRLGRTEVTVGEFGAFVAATGYRTDAETNVGKSGCYAIKAGADPESAQRAGRNWRSPGFAQTDAHPVVCVSFRDAQAYLNWLKKASGKSFRLPSEAEWEYAGRAGGNTLYGWGSDTALACRAGNVADQTLRPTDSTGTSSFPCSDAHTLTAPVGSYSRNGFGLNDMWGNVWEWVEDAYHDSYLGAPHDGHAWVMGDVSRRVLRGGSWSYSPRDLRASARHGTVETSRLTEGGFRVAEDN